MTLPPPDYTFTFTLVSCHPWQTRSKHQDTGYVVFTQQVKPKTGPAHPPITQLKVLGNLNTGVCPINLVSPKIPVAKTDTVVCNYLIVNCSHPHPQDVLTALQHTSVQLAASATPIYDIGKVAWAYQEIGNQFVPGSCDGVVVAHQEVSSFDDLYMVTFRGPYNHSYEHAGIDSPHGCGDNSRYDTTYLIDRQVAPPVYHPDPDGGGAS